MKEIILDIVSSEAIVVNVTGDGGGSITSSLKDICPCCGQTDCYFSCDSSQADESDIPESTETEEDVENRKQFNAAMDGLESIILAHACAGINIETPAYIEGIETALTACGNMFS